MTLDTKKNAILIINPIENSPAEKAGILPGDIITKIDGISYTGDQLDEASNKIKGEAGTKVTLEILRGKETKTFEIERKKVLISHITTKVLDNNIGYMAISDFEGGCADEFREEYLEHIKYKNCKTKECKELAIIQIQEEKCKGCGICKRNCPVNAISGEPGKPHHIDEKICMKCRTCISMCPFHAIS